MTINDEPSNPVDGMKNLFPAKLNSCNELPEPLRLATIATRDRYGDAAKFLITFNPDLQLKVAANPERAFTGDAPTLTTVRHAYSARVLETWIMAQLENLNDFCGAAQKMSVERMESLAGMIMTEYHYFKISEILLFFHRFKCGRYGEFYGVIDPHRIMTALIRFVGERRTEISNYENKRHRKELDLLSKNTAGKTVSRQEYERIKSLNDKKTIDEND